MIEERFVQLIAGEVAAQPSQVVKTLELLNGGATIPFVARYRKDVTGNLDEVKIEQIAERNIYFSSLIDRRQAILKAIAEQDKLTSELQAKIEAATDKTTLEDLYLPYKKQRRTKASVAREKGLEPLGDFLLQQLPLRQPIEEFAASFISAEKQVSSVEEALEGARHVVAERISHDPEVRHMLRQRLLKDGVLKACKTKNADGQKTKYEAYYDFSEKISAIPSHRFLAISRGAKEGFLRMELEIDDADIAAGILRRFLKEPGSQYEPYIQAAVSDAYERLLRPSLENEVLGIIHERADEDAIRVFRENAENLLLSPPAGQIPVIGVDPGMKSGCKLAVVDRHGNFLESATVYPSPPQNEVEQAEAVLAGLMDKHGVNAIAIGNGTGAREAATFVRGLLAKLNRPKAFSVLVSEAGASIYSASRLAREEFPDLDVTVRGAISIARRLQDPLAELVKIEPRHIGVGQYQHDVSQKNLREGLHRTVVSCVNRVGVELNTASSALLRFVSGIHANTAHHIVEHRKTINGFESREQLREVDGVGPKVFEQCAGFLRIQGAGRPLDATGIHPEAYGVVERIATSLQMEVSELLADPAPVKQLDLSPFETDTIGKLTLEDIRNELLKPGRDPRTEFRAPKFLEGVFDVQHLEAGMESEGVVTNVTDFGAFVDIGVHQDGLVHLSELSNTFIRDPREVVKVGDIVRVKVIKVDKELPRISLSMKALIPPVERPARRRRQDERRAARPVEAGAAAVPDGPVQDRAPGDRRPRRGERRGEDHRERRRPAAAGSAEQDGGRTARGPKGRGDRGRHERKDSPRQDRRSYEQGGPLNTLLADQLAKLREKIVKK